MPIIQSIRRYILLFLVVFTVLGLIVANVKAKTQDEQFAYKDSLYQKASHLANLGDYEKADDYIDELLKIQPNNENVNYLGGIIAANTGDIQQASILFKKALDLNPYLVENPVFMFQLGQMLFYSERYDEAKIVLSRCKEMGWTPEEIPNYQTIVSELLNSIENIS